MNSKMAERARLFIPAFFEEKSKKSFHCNPFRNVLKKSDTDF
jgi:hypothetical protein